MAVVRPVGERVLEGTHGPILAWVVAAKEPYRPPSRGQHGDRAEPRQDDGSDQRHPRIVVALRGRK
jgi:hypothetical protein